MPRTNKEKEREYMRRWKAANKDRVHGYYRKHAAKNAVRMKDYYRKRHYGISTEEYNALHAAQNGLCAICGRAETRRNTRSGKVWELCHDLGHMFLRR